MSKHLSLLTRKAFQDSSTHLPLPPSSCLWFSQSALLCLLLPLLAHFLHSKLFSLFDMPVFFLSVFLLHTWRKWLSEELSHYDSAFVGGGGVELDMKPSFSDSDSLLLSTWEYFLRTRIFSYLATVQFSNSGNNIDVLLLYIAKSKSLQSCPTLCDPIDGSPPGSPVPGILQARTLEWVAISFSKKPRVTLI